MRRRLAGFLLITGLLVAACDGDPNQPLAHGGDVASLLNGRVTTGTEFAPHTLPSLLHQAVRRVYLDQGAGAARGLVGELRRSQEQLRLAHAGGDAEAGAVAAQAARNAQLDIVLRVFGGSIAAGTVDALAGESARLRETAPPLFRDGRARGAAAELLSQLDVQLAEARAAGTRGDARLALGHAMEAGATADRLRGMMADARRIGGLAELFDEAIARVRATDGDDDDFDALARYEVLQQRAQQAVRAGDRLQAHAALKAVRDEQLRVTLDVLGVGAAGALVEQGSAALQALDADLAASRAAGRDVSRLGRMSANARDMLRRAREALHAGDAALALDLASHAAGLINSLQAGVSR